MVRIATCQLTPASDAEARKVQIRTVLMNAEADHVDFLCFPEGCLTGYYATEDLARKNSLELGKTAFVEWLDVLKHSLCLFNFSIHRGQPHI